MNASTKSAVVPFEWRNYLASLFERIAIEIRAKEIPLGRRGEYLQAKSVGFNLGRPVYEIRSVRGGFLMGTIEWSNQWHRPKFTPADDAVFDQRCIAELFAMMKEMH